VTPFSALLNDTPLIAAASWTAYWKYSEVPDGTPAGHVKGSGSAPPAFVASRTVTEAGEAKLIRIPRRA
jgi:hypothetical protein